VNMSDVLFDSGKFTLRPLAREKLAKISGIVLAYPDLKLAIEGNTDSVGTEAFNQVLSEERAEGVRSYLTEQGVPCGEPQNETREFTLTIGNEALVSAVFIRLQLGS
jgi:outer membrane protein OmpA-like peptidoglycan-associated protein